MIHYKATTPDATSFYDGYTPWRVGRITRIEDERGTTLCEAGLLHASTEPGESLTGGCWPCRLFVVEHRDKVFTDEVHPHKVGAHAWMVIEELPAWQALGPNGEEVVALLDRCVRLTRDEQRRLAAAYHADRFTGRGVARRAAYRGTRDGTRDAAWDAAWNAARFAVRDAAWNAARDAAIALVVRDLISTEDFDTLSWPWRDVVVRGDGGGE